MSFDGLLPVAKKLAASPPVKVWETLYPQTDDPNAKLEGQALENQAGTICDLNAYVLMVIAAGVTRVEAMKKAEVHNGKAYDADASGGKDRARGFTKKEADDFMQWMTDWAALDGNGAVQFKFKPGKGAHTFVVERVTFVDENNLDLGPKESRFRVYQAYEGHYRLSDFLGTAQDDYAYYTKRAEALAALQFTTPENPTKKQLDNAEKFRKKYADEHVADLDKTAKAIGHGKALAWSAIKQAVIAPLHKMLAGEVDAGTYALMTGVPNKNKQNAPMLVVLLCDYVSPNAFASNYDGLTVKATLEKMTKWVTVEG